MIPRQTLPPAKVIAVDIDGTLLCDGQINRILINWCQQKQHDGYRLMLWSARGLEYAQRFVEHYGLHGIFDDIVSKPGYIVDDQGWAWTRYTHIINNIQGHSINKRKGP